MDNKKRCKWCNLKNQIYIEYHDNEWGVPVYDDKTLLEFLILEPFQAGLSWETILNKREDFRRVFEDYDSEKICALRELLFEWPSGFYFGSDIIRFFEVSTYISRRDCTECRAYYGNDLFYRYQQRDELSC